MVILVFVVHYVRMEEVAAEYVLQVRERKILLRNSRSKGGFDVRVFITPRARNPSVGNHNLYCIEQVVSITTVPHDVLRIRVSFEALDRPLVVRI